MANLSLSWSIEGEQQLSRVLTGLGAELKDYRQPFTSSAEYLKRTFEWDVFNTQGKTIGERWKPLSPATIAAKARQGMFGGPLVATGNMRASFRTVVSTDEAVVYNTAAPYFKFHQSKEARGQRLPRRVMMALGQNQKATIVRYFQEYIQQAIAGI